MSLRTKRAPEWLIPSWKGSRAAWVTAASRRCAINFRIWKKAHVAPEAPALAHSAVRAAVAEARKLCPDLALLEHDPEKWEPVFGKDHAQTKG
jgi:hypothetical protein